LNSSLITLLVVTATYTGIAVGHLPKLRANRTTITLMGVGLLLITQQIAFQQIGSFLDLDTLILLFSMMILNANLRISGFFRWVGESLIHHATNPRTFLALEIVLTGVLSAFFLNDTVCLMFTPLMLDITLAMNRNPIPYLIALATAANIGSVATLTGNPQNMIIGVASGIPYGKFALSLTPIALLGLGMVWLVLVLLYPKEFHSNHFLPPDLPARIYRPLLTKSLIVVAGLLVAFAVGVPVAEAAFLGACILLITRRLRPEKVFAEIDWDILVFFAALFIVTGSIEANGLTGQLMKFAQPVLKENVFSLSALTVVLSNLVSNVPAVLLLRPVIAAMQNPQAGWLTLAAASTLAGNLTLLGSVANLIVAESAKRRRVILSFWEYTRAGLIITLLTMIICVVWLVFFVW
jgi:Na+/H+ antiporter NhaD/arsenite permease-like protein